MTEGHRRNELVAITRVLISSSSEDATQNRERFGFVSEIQPYARFTNPNTMIPENEPLNYYDTTRLNPCVDQSVDAVSAHTLPNHLKRCLSANQTS